MNKSQLLQELQGQSITQGWDVVCAMSADRANSLLAQQYVANLAGEETMPAINGDYPIDQSTGLYARFTGVTLGPPEIAFDPVNDPQAVILSLCFQQGTFAVVQKSADGETITRFQALSPADNYVLTGVVPLSQVQGQVKNQTQVYLDIPKGANFFAHLGVTGAGAATLGTALHGWLIANVKQYTYSLGTVNYDPKHTNLIPKSFQITTQRDMTDAQDKGRLVLLIATTYNPNGGTQTSLPFANIIPDGYTAALYVSSKVFFQNILAPAVQQQLNNPPSGISVSSLNVQFNQPVSNQAASLGVTANVNVGNVSGSQNTTNFFYSGDPKSHHEGPVIVPLSLTISGQQQSVVTSMQHNWSQGFVREVIGRVVGFDGHSITLTTNIQGTYTPTVDPVKALIQFGGQGSASTTFQHMSGWDSFWSGDDGVSEAMGDTISQRTQSALSSLLNFSYPDVNAFAVSALLFPGSHAINLQTAAVPGDLSVFGDTVTQGVDVSPLQMVLTGGQTLQFNAVVADGSAVAWGVDSVGTISTSGLYTAPPSVTSVQQVVVTATSKTNNNHYASAVVTLVPGGVAVNPNYTEVVSATGATLSMTATVDGLADQGVKWSLSPTLGNIAADGTYSPPQVTQPRAVTITATSTANSRQSGSATVLLVPGPALIGLAPCMTTLSASQSAQFSVKPNGTAVTWTLQPAVGTIDAHGQYQAPSAITSPQVVAVIATSTAFPSAYGAAIVQLQPAQG
jgi:hypothetical protein